jgi:plastocyanin
MKFILILLIIAVLGGAFVLITGRSAEAPATAETETEEVTESAGMPVPDLPAVDEMVVTEEDTTVNMNEPSESETTESSTSEMESDAEAQVFNISGTDFAFDVTEMRVKEGDTITINFSSADGFHDWVLDVFDAATEQVRPGTPTSVTFVADTAGTYEYYCSVGSHRANGMVGTLIVE